MSTVYGTISYQVYNHLATCVLYMVQLVIKTIIT